MSAAEELYTHQRPACQFFIREAKLAGIDVYAVPQSDVMNPPPLYGYKEFTRMFAKQQARKAELQARLEKAQQTVKKEQHLAHVFQGALDDLDYMNNTYDPGPFDLLFNDLVGEKDV